MINEFGPHSSKWVQHYFQRRTCYQTMRKGAVLLLDEVDLIQNKLMCLQSVLEEQSTT